MNTKDESQTSPAALTNSWRLEKHGAQLVAPRLQGQVKFTDPVRGVASLSCAETALRNCGVLGVLVDEDDVSKVADVYNRGTDLVVTYDESTDRAARVQLYWRSVAEPGEAIAAIDLQVSVQTNLLDSWPELVTSSTLPATEFLRLRDDGRFRAEMSEGDDLYPDDVGPICYLVRLPGTALSYVEMVHPADAAAEPPQGQCAATRETGHWSLYVSHRLFAESLEKGVIRRARLRGLFFPRERDEVLALAAYQAFSSAEPPLTT